MIHPETPPRQGVSRTAVTMLKADHTAVHGLFLDHGNARTPAAKRALMAQICHELGVHMLLEEELLYPAVAAVLRHRSLVPEATAEHARIKDLIARLEAADIDADSARLDAQVRALAELVNHHVHEAHSGMFPMVEASSIDLVELGVRLAARRRELMAQTA